MSITFYITHRDADGVSRMAYRCDCSRRWCDACDVACANGEDSPEMFSCADCTDVEVNMANGNAWEWMQWVGITPDHSGEIKASELAALCRRRLWGEERNHDPAREGSESTGSGGCRVIECAREPDYLRGRTEKMLRVCEKAGDRVITWA